MNHNVKRNIPIALMQVIVSPAALSIKAMIIFLILFLFSGMNSQTKILEADYRGTPSQNIKNLPEAAFPVENDELRANVGYRDFSYGSTVVTAPTGEKPESKLWWNDDYWWGSMWDDAADEYRIYRLNPATETWENTGVAIDDRSTTKGDALSDGNKLYIASHVFDERGGDTGPANSARLYRYSYNASTESYSIDSGFPLLINSSTSETLVIDKDSAGKLWITWTQNGKVMINCSTTDDLHWNTPIQLPVQTSSIQGDDISSIQRFSGNKIGLMWSDQAAKKIFFAVHVDGKSFDDWESVETALSDGSNQVADDHINLKMGKDGQGNVYAVTKTGLSDNNLPLIYFLKRDNNGNWSDYVFSYGRDDHTRPILLIDESNNLIYVFVKGKVSGVDAIYVKTSDLDNINFPLGVGEPFIKYSGYSDINNPTSTKQTINNRMGLVVLASDKSQNWYFHNTIPAAASGPVITSFTPTSGLPGTLVTINGSNFTGTTSVKFNGVNAASFSVISDNRIQTTVPASATTGPIRITTPDGSDTSVNNFVLLTVPQITSFSPVNGQVGTEVTIAGSSFTGVTGVTFNSTVATSFTVDSDIQIRAIVPTGATTGKIRVANLAGSNTSANNFTVLYPPVITSFTPVSGGVGEQVTITGSHFASATGVRFNGVATGTYLVDSDTQIRANVPVGATTGPVSVTTPDGTGSSANDFTVLILPQIAGFTPNSGPAGTQVTITGVGFGIAVSVKFNGAAAAFNIVSPEEIQAQVPAGASTGLISVTNAVGTGTSATNFTIPEPPFTLAVNINGPGTVQLSPEPDLPGGVYSSITEVTLTAVPGQGYEFDGWGGDLSGSGNPQTILVNEDKTVTASFIEEGSGGPVVFEEVQTGGSAASEIVSTTSPVALVDGDLYLAAVSSKGYESVSTVSGLGLSWTLVMEQCGGRSQTGISVWMARGMPSGDGLVTATLTKVPQNAVITVTRYSGVYDDPFDTVISANTNGLNGSCSNGSDLIQYMLDFNTTQGGSVIYGAVAIRNKTHTPGAGYTERIETTQGSGGSMVGVAIMDQTIPNASPVPLNGTFSSEVDWAVVGIELKSGGSGGVPNYTLAMNVNGGGSVSLDPTTPGNSYPAGTTVTLTAQPDPGFIFDSWSGNVSGSNNPETIIMDSNKQVSANFVEGQLPPYTLSVTTIGSGSVTLNPPGGVYNQVTDVELTALPAAGYVFAGWSGHLSGLGNPQTLTVDGDKEVSAIFVEEPTGGGTVAFEEIQTGGSTGSDMVSTSGDMTAVSGNLYLAAISFKRHVNVVSVSGLGLTWAPLAEQCGSREQTGVAVWMGTGTPTGSSPVTALLSQSPNNAVIAVSRYSGAAAVNVIGTTVSANTNGLNGACSGGTDSDTYHFDFAATATGAIIYSAAAMRHKNHDPGTGYTERAEIYQGRGGSTAGVSVSDRLVASAATVPLNGIFSGKVDWAVIGLEIKPGDASIYMPLAFLPMQRGKINTVGTIQNGSNTSINAIHREEAAPTQYTYLQFRVSGIPGDIRSARLRMYPEDEETSVLWVYPAANQYKDSNELWRESGITAANAPAINRQIIFPVKAKRGAEWVEVNVAGAITGEGIYSFAVKHIAGNSRPVILILERESSAARLAVTSVSEKLSPNPAEKPASGTGKKTGDEITALSTTLALNQNYPNPFNMETSIEYALPETMPVKLVIYNILGQQVRLLADETQPAGYKRFTWNGRDDAGNEVSSGLYFIRLVAGQRQIMQRMILQK
jgi:hypothetical protein